MSNAPRSLTRGVRKFDDVYPSIKERCAKYTEASKWYNLDKMTPELAKLWVQQVSIWTRTGFKMRGHAYANCPYPELRRVLLEVVMEEDVVDPRVGMNHRQLMATSAGRATGQSLDDLKQVRPLATTLVCFDIFYGVANRSWEEAFAFPSGHERVIRDIGYFKFEANRMKRDLGWGDKDVAWFTGHDDADEDHGKVIELIENYISDDKVWDRIEEAVVEVHLAWLLMLDEIVDAHRYGIAPVTGASCKGLSLAF